MPRAVNEPSVRAASVCLALLCILAGKALVGPESARADVLVVKSDDLEQYDAPIAAFRANTPRPSRIVDIDGSREAGARELGNARRDANVEAVFALGGQAAHLSRLEMPQRPLVFAMVLDWQRYRFTAPSAGVAVEIPVAALFTRFKLLLPHVDRIGVIHSDGVSSATLADARAAAATLGMELIEQRVRYGDAVPGAYRRMRRGVDALWMLPDPVVVTRENFRYLRDRTRADKIAFLAFSENFVRAGALLSISPNYETMGAQAAALLEDLVGDPTSPGSAPRVQQPLGSKLVINADTAAAVGLELDASLLSMADVVVEDSPPRR
jgi:putative ABC transport system substrate-binding protein